jgi:sugar (pentulose or hexulose) kinase
VSLVVGVDLGTGSARAVAIDPDGVVVASAAAPYEGRAGWAVGHADPHAWRAAVAAALGLLVIREPAALAPAALAVGGQSPAVVRSDGTAALTVMHPDAGEADPHEAHRRLCGALDIDGVDVVPLQGWDWILFALGAPHHQGRWPETPVLEGFGPVRRTACVAGVATGGWGVAAGTPLVPGGPDAFMAFWAAAVDKPGRGLDPGGRTGGIGVAVAGADAPPGAYGLRSAVPGIDIVGGPVTAHGLAVEWWARTTGRTIDSLLDEAATVEAGARGLLALPYFEGERAPRWNRSLRAEIVGLDSTSDAAQVMRAFLEGCAYGIRHIVDSLVADGVRLTDLVVAGSPARRPLWCQIKADVLGVPVEVPAYPDLAAYGAALAAGAAAGWWPRPGEGAPGDWPRGTYSTIEPRYQPAHEDAYHRWVALGDAAVARLSGP